MKNRSIPPVAVSVALGLVGLAAAPAESHGRSGQGATCRSVARPQAFGHVSSFAHRTSGHRTFRHHSFSSLRSFGHRPFGLRQLPAPGVVVHRPLGLRRVRTRGVSVRPVPAFGIAPQPLVYAPPYVHGLPILDPDDVRTPTVALGPSYAPAPAPAPAPIIIIQMPAAPATAAPAPASPPPEPAYRPPPRNPNARPDRNADPGRVHLWLAQPEAAVVLDGEALGPGDGLAEAPLELAAGVHALVVRHPDYGAERLVFAVPDGGEILIEINLMGDRSGRKARIRTAWELESRLGLLGR